MSIDVNAVAVFFDDGTYKLRTWDKIAELEDDEKTYVTIAIFHVQNAGNQPNVVRFTGDSENIALKTTGAGMKVHCVSQPPGGNEAAESSFFKLNSTVQTLGAALPTPAYAALAAMTVSFYSMDFDHVDYITLQGRAATKSNDLRTATPPDDGTY